MTRVFESNGPDIKIRGTASHVAEKYVQLARDARSSGDPVAAENYYQHAEHYFRIIAAAQEQLRQNQPQPRVDNEMSTEEGDDERKLFELRARARFRAAAAAAVCARQRPARNTIRDQHQQPREHREHRPQPQYQPQPPNQPQPVIADAGVDRLPSFITGSAQPQVNAPPAPTKATVASAAIVASASRAAAAARTVRAPTTWPPSRRRAKISIRATSR